MGEKGEKWPTITFREEEEKIKWVESVADDPEVDRNLSDIWRYIIDRKFEQASEDWEPTTEPSETIDRKLAEYSRILGIETDFEGLYNDLLEETYTKFVTLYTVGLRDGNEDVKDIAAEYLEENFPDDEFTRHLLD